MSNEIKKNKLIVPVFFYSFASFLSKISGYLRDFFLASFMGTSALSDIFFIAFKLPYSFRRLLSEESFNPAYIPVFGKVSELDNKDLKYQFTRKIFILFILISSLITLFVEIFMSQILSIFSYGFDDPIQQEILVKTSRIIFPYLIFIALTAVFIANLNANKKFAVSGGIPSILNLSLVIGIVSFDFIGEDKLFYLGWTIIIGGFFQILILCLLIEKNFWKILFRFKRFNTNLKSFYKLYWPSLVYSSFFQINLLIGIFLCSFQQGAVSYLYYAERLFYLPLTLIGIAIGVVLVPNLSDYLRNKNNSLAIEYMYAANKYALITILPLTGFLLALSPEIVTLLFERGEFSSESSKNTSVVLNAFLIGLPAATMAKVFTPYFFAIEKPKIYLRISTFANIINLCFMLILFYFMGYVGIPIAFSISSYALIISLIKAHKKRGFFSFDKIQFYQLIKYLLFSLFIFFACSEISSIKFMIEIGPFYSILISAFISALSFFAFIFMFERSLYNQSIKFIGKKSS